MSEIERQRRLKAIATILSNPDVPGRLRADLEDAREDLSACVVAQELAARSWRHATAQATRRRGL